MNSIEMKLREHDLHIQIRTGAEQMYQVDQEIRAIEKNLAYYYAKREQLQKKLDEQREEMKTIQDSLKPKLFTLYKTTITENRYE